MIQSRAENGARRAEQPADISDTEIPSVQLPVLLLSFLFLKICVYMHSHECIPVNMYVCLGLCVCVCMWTWGRSSG